MANQAPPAPLEVPKESNQNGGQGKKAKDLKGMGKGQDKKKLLLIPRRKPQILLPLSSVKLLTY